jgi:hypothetical protein
MSRPKSPAAMTPDEFRAILDATGLTRTEACALLGASSFAVCSWLTGRTPIARDRARLIRARLTPAGPSGRTPGVARVTSPQSEHQRAAIAAGRCSRCCVRPLHTKWQCAECAAKTREAARRRLGCKPWRKGGRGRPPKGALNTEARVEE